MNTIPCWQCSAPVPPDHTFCGQCGAALEKAPPRKRNTQPLSPLMASGRARLLVLKGAREAHAGQSFMLGAAQHPAGREEGVVILDDDPFASPLHANFFYLDKNDLYVKDEESLNGTFLRLREPARLKSHDRFIVGQQVFQFEYLELAERYPDQDGTLRYVSPQKSTRFRLLQLLDGGRVGQIHASPTNEVTIGREGCDLNFPDDPHMSRRHARLSHDDKGFLLQDSDSTNGTFLRLREAARLSHGDCVMMGQHLLRVEVNPA